ncbi:phage tail tape measure protein [Chryseobacterium flavum]|uniref:phage tail tape measure protein n=1 Tax=Chryseobacterium flavum TaxID=415851 RepID=UPI0028B14A4E|nr:phage tail tape measure protein [Chryseobacterium flavum]
MAGRTTISTTGVLYINGAQVENTFQNLNRITRNLERELRRLPVGTQEFNERAEELRRARQRFQEVRNEIDSVSGTLNNASGFLGLFRNGLLQFGDTFREVFSANLAERFFDVIIDKGKETVDQLLKISDAMTDVEKTTGMSTDQVKELWTQFDQMDTRTNKLERLKIAEVGGRLGVPIEEMKDFVQEVDKAYVALGDSFEGGLEGVVDQLGKIKGLFNGTQELSYAEAINKIGSALNTLAAQGTASEGNIAQFALRVGNLPESLRPSIDKVLGLGAAFEESGIDAQIAASGFSNFISQAGEGIDSFAISMHMSTTEAKTLLNTKPEEFFLRFAQGMKGLSATETAKVFSSLKLNSLEVQKAVGAAANKTDEFKKAMKTAGIEMDKMTSLSDEFNKKNNNAPAILEKIKNAFNDTFTSTNIINKFESLIQAIGWLTGVTDESGNGMVIFKERLTFLYKTIIVLISGVIGYNAAMLILVLTTKNAARETLIYNLVQKAKAAWDAIARATTLLVAVAYNLLTGNIVRATAAMRAFNIATKANLIGILVGVITAVVVAIALFSKEVDEAAAKQKMLNEINKDAEKGIISQKRELEQLVKTAKDENLSKEQRADAIQKLNKLSPEYLGNLTLENIRTQEATNAIKAYSDALLRNSKIKVLNKKLDEINEKIIDEQDKPLKEIAKENGNWVDRNLSFLTASEIKFMDKDQRKQFEIWKKKGGDDYAKQMMDAYGYIYEKRNQAIQKLSNDANTLSEQIADLSTAPSIEENTVPKNIPPPDKPKDKDPNKKNKDDLEKARDAYNKAIDAKAEADKKASELERARIDEQFKIWEENKQKEWDVELQDYENRKNELQQQTAEFKNQIKKTDDEIKKLERDKKETKNPAAAAEYENAIAGLQDANKKRLGLIDANAKMEDQIFQTHGFNLLRIEEKYQTKSYEKQVESLQAKIDNERKSAEDSINNITSMDEAREALSKMSYLRLTETELKAIQTLEDAKKALRENADRAYLKSQEIFLIEQKKLLEQLLQDPSLSSEATEKLKKDLDELKIKITEVQSAMSGGKESDDKKVKEEGDTEKEKVDILGFSAKEWETAWKNLDTTKGKLGAVKMVIQALGNAFQAYYQLQNALAEREMSRFQKNNDKKKKELLGQLNSGLITQEEYNKKIQGLDAETANKKAEIAYKQAKTERALKVAEIIANTSLAIMQAYSQLGPIGGTVAAVLIGTLGAIQLGTVLATPLPDKPTFYQGGHTGRGFGSPDETGHVPAGIVHANEWVAPAWMLENPKTAQVIDYLESVRQGKTKPFAQGGFTEPASENSNINPLQTQVNLLDVVSENVQVMNGLKNLLQKIDDDGGIEAFMIADAKNGKLFKKATKEFEIIENRNARK